ncbi:MAG: selenocysteine-specific translation elongation factor [Gemmatimonadetes bacterium]|nr:selenocysteine-specific translation elongation factor [Gemmatimonadota bacterium]
MKRLILGTAGHIDHGKTSLVQALTGIDTDRLKEEKERGITIDLGFAEFSPKPGFEFGVVDVPGHEGFIRNMVAGATGMDLVLLVIASDESVMPQTREHLDILQILGVSNLIVAMTKADLVDREWRELVAGDIEEFLEERSFYDVPIIPVSVKTGLGLAEIMSQLMLQAEDIEQRSIDDLVRMPIDRVFSIKGTGTVATGTLWSGCLRQGSEIVLQPSETRARIRGLEVHGEKSKEVVAGQRVALAVSGTSVSTEDVQRGQVVIDSPNWKTSFILTSKLQITKRSPWNVRHGQRLRVHLGTDEVMARAILLESDEIPPGGSGWIQLRLEQPLLARVKDRLVVRSYSPVTTIGGAIVGEVCASKRKKVGESERSVFESIIGGSREQVFESVVGLAGWKGIQKTEFPIKTGFSPKACDEVLERALTKGFKETSVSIFGVDVINQAKSKIRNEVGDFHKINPLSVGMPIEAIRNKVPVDDGGKLTDVLIDEMVRANQLKVSDGLVYRTNHSPVLSADQELLVNELLDFYEAAKLEVPEVASLPVQFTKREDLWSILKYLEHRGDLVALNKELFVKTSLLEDVLTQVRGEFEGQKDLSPSDFKISIPVSRKYLIPILSYCDRRGVTVREKGARSVPLRELN